MPDTTALDSISDSYSRLAPGWAAMAATTPLRPITRTLIEAFAERLWTGGVPGPVADVGCGPGRETALLSDLGLDAFGVDLAPGMVDEARRAHPALRFEVGSLLSLDVADNSLAGLLASYSIIHLRPEQRPRAFAEFHRVLAPGGLAMLLFQVGSDSGHRTEADGHEIDLPWHRLQPADVTAQLRTAGFTIWLQTVREPDPDEKVPQACVIARKPAPPEQP